MPAAVDTNVLLPVLRGDADSAGVLVPFLDRFIGSMDLVISGPVYAELAAAPGMQALARVLRPLGMAQIGPYFRDTLLPPASGGRKKRVTCD